MSGSADEQLAAIRAAQDQLGPAQQRGRRQLAWLCSGLGVLLGVMHLIIIAFPPAESLRAFQVACAVVVAAILLLTLGYLRIRRVVPRGAGRRYLIGLGASLVLYVAALVLALLGNESLGIAVGVAVVIAAPLLVAAVREVRR